MKREPSSSYFVGCGRKGQRELKLEIPSEIKIYTPLQQSRESIALNGFQG